MKKILLTTIALLTVASMQVFGSYGVGSGDWITFLTDGNRFEAKLDQLGFTLGNDMIKGTFGFHNDGRGTVGDMLLPGTGTTTDGSNPGQGFFYDFIPTISMGLGYTSSIIGIGVGYNATIGPRWDRYNNKTESKKVEAVVHTPVLVLNAMDNAFRMAIPIQVFVKNQEVGGVKQKEEAVSVDSQFRYYTGLDILPQVRWYLRYGNYSYNDGTTKNKRAESFGFDFRLYFGSVVEEVALQPIVRLVYNGALGKQHNVRRVQAVNAMNSSYSSSTAAWEQGAWDVKLLTALGLTANSDIVSLYFEPSLGLDITQSGSATQKVKETYGLAYDVYAEIYITPIKNLEWYFEASIGNIATQNAALAFAGTTGITWYLPAL